MSRSDRPVQAFVPGHVTAFFSPRWHDDPARTGAIGAGITLSDGVTVRAEPADETAITLNGRGIEMAPVEAALAELDATVNVMADSPLPVGAGFGVSGALTLGAALATNHVSDVGCTENELVSIAHRAEVRASTGLGDVVAQARGGVPIRLEAGDPDHGKLDGVPGPARIEYLAFGELSTSDVITGDTEALSAAGERALSGLTERPSLQRVFELGRRFAREADLMTPRVEAVIGDVRSAGGDATMAMLGETVVALGSGLSDAGYDAQSCTTCPGGAALEWAPPG